MDERRAMSVEHGAKSKERPYHPPISKVRGKEGSKSQNPPSIPPLVRGDKEGLWMSEVQRAKGKELIAESEEQKAIGREFYPLGSTVGALCFFFLCSMLFALCFFASVADAKM